MKNIYDGLLQFRGTWRTYQERVLANSQKYLEDGKVHIVAAPGSGKTTLGIELIRRLGLRPSFSLRALPSGSSGWNASKTDFS